MSAKRNNLNNKIWREQIITNLPTDRAYKSQKRVFVDCGRLVDALVASTCADHQHDEESMTNTTADESIRISSTSVEWQTCQQKNSFFVYTAASVNGHVLSRRLCPGTAASDKGFATLCRHTRPSGVDIFIIVHTRARTRTLRHLYDFGNDSVYRTVVMVDLNVIRPRTFHTAAGRTVYTSPFHSPAPRQRYPRTFLCKCFLYVIYWTYLYEYFRRISHVTSTTTEKCWTEDVQIRKPPSYNVYQ